MGLQSAAQLLLARGGAPTRKHIGGAVKVIDTMAEPKLALALPLLTEALTKLLVLASCVGCHSAALSHGWA